METSRRTAAFSAVLVLLLGSAGWGEDLRTVGSRKEQSCEDPMAARKLDYDQHYFIVPPPPSDFDASHWTVFPWCRGAGTRDNEPVRGVKWSIKNGIFFSQDETIQIPFPAGRVKTKAGGAVIRGWGAPGDQFYDAIMEAFESLWESRQRSAFFFVMDPLGGKKVDLLVTECGVTFAAPCMADADTWCLDHDGIDDRFQIDFSALNNGNFALEANLNGGTLTFPDNPTRWWAGLVKGPWGITLRVRPDNQQAADLFVQPGVFDLFDNGITVTDRVTGDMVTGPNTRDPEWNPLEDSGNAFLDFVDPRVIRLGAKIEF